ncbi:hypothetical protein JTE90_022639 [Oedothorax gibbosus]|uniref:Uncharacterized protein n=1 Tax=Oedothorax gibbosus TaxID=931172 RepID=A0AAV6TUT0_9ARAC|nr:hypothetical protein JTE90_022639 [Oedothorax gibbosus]
MDSYTSLVSHVLDTPTLKERIEGWPSDVALNLITEDWKERLQQSILYKTLKHDSAKMYTTALTNNMFKVQYLQRNNLSSDIYIVAVCSIHQPYNSAYKHKSPFSIQIHDCEALNMLAMAMTRDVNPTNTHLSDTAKFNFKTCSFLCRYCQEAREDLKGQGVTLSVGINQPCICDIETFDGTCVERCFAQQMQGYLQGKFVAILHLELTNRYFYPRMTTDSTDDQEVVRIGGFAKRMVAFPESNLMATPKVPLSKLSTLKPAPVAVVEKVHPVPTNKRQLAFDDDEEEEVVIHHALPTSKHMKLNEPWDSDDEDTEVEEEKVVF